MADATLRPASAAGPDEPVRVHHTVRDALVSFLVVAFVAATAFFGLRTDGGGNAAAKGTAGNPVRIGVVGATDPQWPVFREKAEEAGIHVEIIDFQDYTSENPALDAGDLDLNEFQHLLYLADYNVQNGKDLQPIGGVAIYPLGLYSAKVDDVDDIEPGSTVAIPNDETNQARAIGVLKAAGLVELKGDWTAFSTPADIDTARSKVKVTPLKAEQVANALNDPTVAAGVINNVYVADAGLDPDDAIYQDDAASEEARPYINVFVARKADVDNDIYRRLIGIFQSKDVLDRLLETSKGTAIVADGFSAADLQGYLADIERDAAAR